VRVKQTLGQVFLPSGEMINLEAGTQRRMLRFAYYLGWHYINLVGVRRSDAEPLILQGFVEHVG